LVQEEVQWFDQLPQEELPVVEVTPEKLPMAGMPPER
jgi:hypothetical protein